MNKAVQRRTLSSSMCALVSSSHQQVVTEHYMLLGIAEKLLPRVIRICLSLCHQVGKYFCTQKLLCRDNVSRLLLVSFLDLIENRICKPNLASSIHRQLIHYCEPGICEQFEEMSKDFLKLQLSVS